jgi:hypothetical protein
LFFLQTKNKNNNTMTSSTKTSALLLDKKNKNLSSSQKNNKVTILNLKDALSRQVQISLGKHHSLHNNSSSVAESTSSAVSFSRSLITTMAPTLRRDEYTPSERKAAWYDSREYRSLKVEQRKVVQLMEQGDLDLDLENDDEAEFSARGLESKTKDGSRQRTLAIVNAVCAVLGEQDDQIIPRPSVVGSAPGTPDPESLAQTYRMYTLQSQNQALERAMIDRLAVSSFSS